MKLKQIVDDLAGLPEWAKELYQKGDDGKFYLDVEGLGEMRVALKEANGEAAKRRKELERFKDVDPDKYAELVKKAEELENSKNKGKDEWEKVREQMVQKHQEEITKLTNENNLLRSNWESEVVGGKLAAAILSEKGRPHFLTHELRKFVKTEFKDGRLEVTILNPDGSGNPMIADASGKLADFGHLVKHFKGLPEWGAAFEGVNASGGGKEPGQGGAGGSGKSMSRSEFEAKSPAEQMAFAKTGGIVTD